jgi:acyl transferase domain-containing protein/acyl carrier protein
MRHRMLPASLHFEQQNPQINLNASPFYVVSSPRAWEAPHSETGRPQPRRAGISSFGFGGANAHVIVEEAPAPVSCRCDDLATGLFVLSGHTKAALTEQVERLAVLLRSVALNGLTPSLADVAFTLQVGREAMNERLAVIASDKDTLLQILDGYLSGTAERSSRLFQGSVARGSPIRPRPATRWTAHELVRTLALERNLDRLAQLWVAGEDVDWRSLYGTNVPRRISLPTYPFARARHWVAPADPPLEPLQGARPDQAAPATSSQWTDREPSDHDRSPMPVMAFEPIWREAPQAAGRKLSGTLVVLHADARSADSLRHALAREAPALRLVMAPLETADFETTAANLVHAHASPFHVVHLAPAVGANAKDVAAAVDGGFHAALRFCRAWMKERGGELQYLYAYADDGGELAPHAAMAGFAYSLRWENPQLRMRLLRHPASGSGELARILLAELSTAYDGADVWIEAGTGGRRRLTRTWQKVELPAAPVPPLFGAAGAHIVTGGTGRLGLFVAERMQRRGAATIILVGRSAPSPEAHERIERLRAAGVDVICERADIARRSDVEQLVSKAKDRCGQIAGVVHAAGLRRDSFVLRKTSAEAEAVLGPKVYGTLWLDAATRREPLVYFVTFSSAAAVFGNGGQADYAFANSFTDHFIERREQLRARGQRRGRSLVIDWPLWAEGAMRIDAAAQEWMSRELGMRPMPADAALDGLERAMAAKAPRLLLAVGDENKMRRALDLGPPLPIAPVTSSAALAQPADIKERVEGFLLQILSRELKMPVEAISTTTPFDDYGIDSLLAGSITRAMETSLGVLPKTLFFEYLTVEQLAGYLLTHHAARLAQVAAGRGTDASAGMVADPPHRRAARARGVQPVEPATRAHHLIAIIGVAGRYPQADDLREFWRNLREGRNCIEEIPKQRWDHNQFYDPNPDAFGKSYSKWGGFLRDIDKFDPMFFRMSRREAELIDPQERIFLGTVWHLLEDAGYTQASLADARMGVFVGTIEGQYHLLGIDDALRGGSLAPSSSNASVANRVSHVFNFRGPSIAVDTMCSSSLVAVHLACSAIRNGDCDMAIAGGVSVCSHPIKYLQLCERRFLSADGRCRSFGEGGTGYVPGEGSGAILLKPLAAAIADSDRILAVIGGSAVNHGGAGKNYTAPNPKSQANLIREVLDRAGVDPDDVNYIEAHGTGTALGDPIEIEGLSRVYGGRDPSAPRCPVGSVKSNIGHAEAAAGIAGVTKVLLQMQHGMLVPSLHAERLNPNIDFAATPFYVQRDLAEWRPPAAGNGSAPRTAAVSSFGAGGTNAHIILQEYARDAVTHRAAPPPYLFVLSARSHSRLRDYAARWAAFLREEGADVGLPGMAYTLQIGREAMAHRLSILFTRRDELLEKLDHWRAGGADPAGVWSGSVQSRSAASREPDEQAVESLDRLAERWVQGGSVNWARLYDDAPPRRVSLPGYPFERERCWLPKASEGATSTTVSSLADADRAAAGLAVPSPAVAPASTLRSLQLLSKEWEDRPVRPAADSTGRAVAILATAATCDLAGRLAARLPDSEVVKPADLPARLRSFEAGTRSIGGVIDLAGCGDRRQPDGDDQSTDWLRWLQRLIGGGRRDLRMLFVSKGLERFGGNEVNLSGAARVGLYRMLQSEYGHVRSCHLDLDPQTSDDEMVGLIAAELGNCSDVEVCYRGGTRYRSVLRNAPCVGAPPRWTFPADQALWITGGTRGLGLRCARHFVAQHGVRRLVLTGKQELPSREQWNRYRFDEGPLGRKLRALQELIDQNVHLEVLSVPLIDEAGLAEALLESKRTMGRPFGVIHCAGSLDPENLAFIRKPVDRMEAVLAPKVAGLDRLIACFRDEQLRFFLLFSSVAAAVPALATGLSDYALANAYMDYVAEARVHGLPLVSLQWPSWKQGGMGEVRSAAYRRSGLGTLSDAEGLALLDRVLDGSAGRVVMPVVMEDPAAWDPAHLTSRTFAAPASAAEPAAASQHDTMPHARRQRADDAAHSAETEQAAISWMLDVLAAELHFDRDRLSAAIPLQDYGADSVMLTHLLQIAAKRLDVRLDPSAFLEYPTVQALISWLADEHAIAFSRAFADSVASSGSHPAVRCADRPRPEPSVEQAARDRQHAAPEPTGTPLDIAVVGMSCRFPESATLDQYWQLLSEGRSALGVIPPERWGYASAFRAGLIEGYGKFDPGFFLIRDEDAAAMDPQALLLLEETLSLFCHAGYRPEEFKGKTIGVYIGGRAQHFPAPDLLLRTHNPIVAVGQNYLAANISQFFDLRGPSVVVDTACSSALVAMNMAILALKAGDIDAAVVGGVSLLNSDSAHRVLQQRGILSTAPEFHVFDNRAHGVIPAEGVGLVLLKPLAGALSEGDRVYALIKALAINNSGRTAGPAAPNPSALRSVMNNALMASGRDAASIAYVEANGSGSTVTDLIELKALKAIYRASTQAPCGLGSIKPNIGHPMCAEGIATFIKVVLMLYHRQQVPFLSGQEPLEHFDLAASPFQLQRRLTDWSDPPLVAAINCFGDGGTNAHAIVEALEADGAGVTRRPLTLPKLNRRPVTAKSGAAAPPDAGAPDPNNVWGLRADPAPVDAGRMGRVLLTLSVDHPVVSGHRLQGRNILPGLAYIDLVYQTFRMHGHRFAELELRDLAILRPLIVPKDRTISLAVECDPIEVGRWRVQVVERDAAERPYATAEMAASKAAPFSEELESTAMAEPSGTAKALERIYADYRQHGLAHSGFIQARGEVDERDDELIVDVAIGDHAHRSAEQFIFHPTLLDGSGVAAASLLRTMVEGQDRLFLPFHLASFRSTAALQQRCFARIRRASVRVKAELLYLTVEFFDASRRKVGELRDVAGKLVRPGALQAASERPAWTATMPAPPPVPTTGALEMLRRRVAAHIGGSAEAINVDVGFYELGLDSFKLVDLVNEIAADLATKLPPTLPFEHTTIRNLAIHLEQSFPNAFGRGNARPAVSVEAADTVSTAAQPESITSAVRSDTCEVAIIGMAGRYPGANDIESFFTNLKRGRNCITDVPGSRWHQEQVRGIHSATGRPISRWGGFVEDAECFDAEFFHISAREAEIMDPQERLFMQTCWEAIEDAGHTPATLCRPHGPDRRHRVGVFVGVMHKDYMLIGADAAADGTPLPLALNQGQIANRISFFCDFHGPSITVDTLCSSSLTAVHLAVESVRRGESEAAIAGGVNLSLHPGKYVTYGLANLHASDGLCRAFGEGGDGYVSAEGVGAIVLKPLASALRDGDNIYAVIRASAVGHGGKVAGISVPSPAGQADVIARSLADAAIEARTVGYVEAHGTGTALGDPIEIEGLARVYRRHTTETGFCAIGSVKTNIGHAEAAAGIAAITKTALQLHHKVLVPSLHSDPPNSRLSLAATPFRVQNTLEAWVHRAACDGAAVPRRAGVSSFGATGSNAHIILEEVLSDPVGQPAVAAAAAFVVPISARTEDQLESYVKKIRAILPPCLPDLAAQLRRMLADIVAVDEANLDSAAAWPRTVVESDHLTVLAERLSEETKLDVAAADLVRAGSLAATAQWLRDLRAKSAPSLAELAYTLQVGRVAHENRVAFIVRDAQELDHKIGVFLHSGGQAAGLYRGQASGNKDLVDLLQGEDGYRELLRGWFANGAIHKIAEAWVKGFDVDWALFYGARPPRRAHLPTYPFARRRYWIADNRETANRRPLAAAAGPAADATRNFRLLTKQWEPAAPVSSAPAAGAGDRPNISRTIVVLANAETAELAGALARRLPDSHQTVLLGVDAPGSRADPQWDRCDGWIDLIGCGAKADDASMAWLQSLQRFVEFGRRDAMRVLCVTRSLEAWQVPSVNLAGASRAGLYRTLQSEYRYLRSRHLDVDIALEDADALARLIASEFAIEADDPAICHRAGRRLRPYLQEEAFTPAPTRLAFPEDHVLWITGGTRGLGAACAQHFVQQYGVRRLVVTGREQFPPRGEWDERADEFPGLASKIAAICALEAAGARVQLLALPLSDRAAVTRSLQEVKETLGPIGGVIHAAGLADHDNPAFIRKSLATFGQVLEPKIAGLNVLYDSLRQEPLRFFLTFSSVSAAVPSLGAGQCDYATANAYMDFFAAAHAGECPIVSIEWPSWKETGMGPATGSAYYRTGLTSHGTADGLRLLDLILAGKFGPVVLPAVIDPMRWNPRALLGRSIAGDRPAARPRAANEAPSDQAPEALAVVRARLKELFAEELKVSPDRFEDDRPFQDYGVDSIILAQILQPVNRQAAEPIDPSVVYEHSTFNSLAAWFVRTPGALAGIQVAAEAKSTPAEPAPRPAARLRAPRRAAPLVSVPISGDVAVVGLSCRFPGAETLDDYWRLLAESRSAIQPVPRRRWGRAGNYYAALLEDIGSFDPDFFAIPDEDAKAMDPQALLLLEEALKLACHAGYEASELKGRPIGVYIGGRSQHRPGENEQRRARNLIRVVGQNYLATNISHFFDLHGPSLVVDTACSSGLVGMNLAIRALLAGEIEAAIVGAVSLLTSEAVHAGFEQRGILSPHSVFHLFDQRAHGIIPGEGCGMVLLKTVDRAVQDNDRIYAVIKALAVNNCGKTAGPAAPNFDAQKHLLQTALARSGRRSDDVGYVETNGSGSVVTDILELKTIEAVYRNESSTPCSLGSIKPNIGHPLSAEGIASFIKVVLMIQHRQRVPFLSGQQPLRHFDLAASPLFFDHARVPWTDEQRTAAINCFADGGTNAHAVVEAASGQAARTDARMPLPVPALCRRPVFQANGEMPAATAAEDLADEYRESPPLMVWEKYG